MGGHFIFEHYLTPAERVFENKNKNPWEKTGTGPKHPETLLEHPRNTPGTPSGHPEFPGIPPDGPDPDPSGWPMRDLQFFNKYLLPNLMSTVFEEYYS